MTTKDILFKKISALETELQRIKLEAYWGLSPRQRMEPKYPEQAVLNAVKLSRNNIWQKRYVKKV